MNMITRRSALRATASMLASPAAVRFSATRISARAQMPVTTSEAALQTSINGPSLDLPIVVKWKSAELGIVYGPNLIVGDGVLYVGDSGSVNALDTLTGNELWRFWSSHGNVEGVAFGHGMVFGNCLERAGSSIQALDATNGTERWRYIPVDAGSWGVVVTDTDVLSYTSDGYIVALDPESGVETRRIPASVSYASGIAIAGNTVYFGSEPQNVISADLLTGAERWRFDLGAEPLSLSIGDDTVFIATGSGQVIAIEATGGLERWRISLGDLQHQDITVGENILLVSSGSSLYTIERDSGALLWTFSSGIENIYRHHSITGDTVYLAGDYLYALDLNNGSEIWRYGLIRDMVGSPWFTIAEETIFIMNDGQRVYAIGNMTPAILAADVSLRGAPSETAIERGTAVAGTEIDAIGAEENRNGVVWYDVTIGGIQGWIPGSAIDPDTLPPSSDVEIVYQPES